MSLDIIPTERVDDVTTRAASYLGRMVEEYIGNITKPRGVVYLSIFPTNDCSTIYKRYAEGRYDLWFYLQDLSWISEHDSFILSYNNNPSGRVTSKIPRFVMSHGKIEDFLVPRSQFIQEWQKVWLEFIGNFDSMGQGRFIEKEYKVSVAISNDQAIKIGASFKDRAIKEEVPVCEVRIRITKY
jgi:hypothetical protein